jgi:type VI secretion system protein ImpM
VNNYSYFKSNYLMSSPSVWGKFPTSSDFISFGIKSDHALSWTNWLSSHAPPVIQPKTKQSSSRALHTFPWTNLDTKFNGIPSNEQAVCFMLQPNELFFARNKYVIGVILHSVDKTGRKHPFIVYSLANRRWLKLYWERDHHNAKDWQFWLCQLIQCAFEKSLDLIDADLDVDALSKANNQLQSQLLQSIQQLWHLHSPGWSQFLYFSVKRPSSQQCQDIIDAFLQMSKISSSLSPAQIDSSMDKQTQTPLNLLKGVQRMPWADWPYRMWRARSTNAFWQQDAQGRYIGASERLSHLKVALFY